MNDPASYEDAARLTRTDGSIAASGTASAAPRTLVDLIFSYPESAAAETVAIFLDASGCEVERYTRAGLAQASLRAAARLLKDFEPGRPVLLAVEAQADLVLCFCGALTAGLLPAPMAPLRRRQNAPGYQRLRAILLASDITDVIVDSADADWLRAALAEDGVSGVRVLTVEALKRETEHAREPFRPVPAAVAYLQFTSGSTSTPKGVTLEHRNVIANLELMERVFGCVGEPMRGVSWLPLHHDMGLVGHLFTVLHSRGMNVFLPPVAFLARPSLWLEAVNRYRARMSAAPSFALEHCVRKAEPDPNWDLRCWDCVFVGSETVSLPVLERFLQKFGPFGLREEALRPVYGLAEASLLAAGGSLGLETLRPRIHTLPSGRRLPPYTLEEGASIRIRDPETGEPSAEGATGEIWIAGSSVAPGYYGEAPRNRGMGLATGDLGYVRDGALYITGRRKEIVVIRGQNHSAEDLEFAAVANCSEIKPRQLTVCVSEIGEDGERLLLFQEVERRLVRELLLDLSGRMTSNLVDAFGIAPDVVVFLPTGLTPRTPNNKVARRECLRRYRSGELKALAEFGAAQRAKAQPRDIGDDPAVIVGMACRFPGAATPDEFWRNLCAGVDSITEAPADRWDNAVFYDAKPATPGKVNTKWGGFVDGVSLFDSELFGISPYEAPEIDPQQRMLLETSWRLIENVGWSKARLAKSATGVFIGISTNDYLYSKIKLSAGMATFNAYSGLGNANSIAANRLSYFYDLRGPSLAVDTACSSSLTAFHLGAQAILAGECDQAIVGGVNALLSPGPTITLSQFGMMAPDGRCKTFDARADGYVRAEGCGLVMLKRRSAARADGDRILAVLDASVIGQDGASPGITFPNGAAQHALITRALTRARLRGAEISYLEAHGTGTAAGDPVEVEQLRAHYGEGSAEMCALGSVKANVGHLEAAAGIASVIKILLMLEHGKIPPQIHVETLNPRLLLDGSRLYVPRALAEWTAEGPRRAAISSFGFGGSLAHVILAEPERADRSPTAKLDLAGEHAFPLTISAPSAEALKAQLGEMSAWLNSFPQMSYRDICRTQAVCRSHLRYRSAITSTSRKGAAEKLDLLLQANRQPLPAADYLATCFLFTGQGEHYLHMGRELYARFPIFRKAFDRCAATLDDPDRPFALADLAFRIEDTRLWSDLYMQPILFAVQYALGALLRACGVLPTLVIGHSIGEYAAACLAGCLRPEDAMRILYRRAELIQSLGHVGAMAVIFAPRAAVEAELDMARAQVAAVNSPNKTVISGHGTEVDRMRDLFGARGIESYFLKTTQAFHSHYLAPILDDFRRELTRYSFTAPSLPWISTLTGVAMTAAPDADYWTRHMREPVLFSEALASVDADAFVEIGPGASSLAGARETLRRKDALFLRTLNPKKGERTESYFLVDAIGQLHTRGAMIDWDPILPGVAQPDRTPGLAFMQRRYWMQEVSAEAFSALARAVSRAPAKQEASVEADWHYAVEWRELGKLAEQAEVERRHNWLVVAPPGPMVEALRTEVVARDDDFFWLNSDPGQTWSGLKAAGEASPGADASEWAKALAHIFDIQSRAGATAWKVLFLAGARLPAAEMERAHARDFGCLLPMLQALRRLAVFGPIWLLSEDAQSLADAAPSNLSDAALWGFGKTLFLEHPEWRGGMIDLTAADDPAGKARNVLRKALAPEYESCVVLRGDRQYAQKIARASLPPVASPTFRGDGAFVVTGGLGGLGLATAKWIVEKGGRRLILLSRRAFPPRELWSDIVETDSVCESISKIRSLEEAGAEVEIRALDVRDTKALDGLFAELDREQIPVRGVIHAAGENWFGKVMALDLPRFLDTLRTKTSAAWTLHRLTADRDLDCFILFSSVSAQWGSVELSHYSAANQVLDVLSRMRAAQNLPALCIDWGPWAEVGMSAMPAERAVLEKLGFSLMRPDRAIAAMETASAARRPLSLVADIDWGKFQVFIDFCLQPSLFADVAASKERRDLAHPNRLDAILSSPPEARRDIIEKVVRMELRTVTLIESSDSIDADQRFNFMGMDSLMALSFAAALENYFRLEVPSTLAYNYPTIRAVTDFLLQELTGAEPRAEVSPRAEPPQAAASVRALNAPVTGPILCCLPFAGSGVSAFRGIAAALEGRRRLVGLQIPGREDHDHAPAFRRMQALVEALLDAFVGLDDCVLYGHSMGAVIAFELALALQEHGRTLTKALIVSGSNPPAAKSAPHIHQLPPEDFVAEVMNGYVGVKGDAARELALHKNRDLLRADLELLETYRPSPGRLRVPLAAIHCRGDRLVSLEEMRGWSAFTDGDFLLRSIDGGHDIVAEQPEKLSECIENAMSLIG